ncbi:MAG: twin-arginine translocation signal domain-containing protein [Desulfobacteraceae bacterium]|nr:twin-arginine translocation signal domain-containing protein [Desulfobacteraceae bacterium]
MNRRHFLQTGAAAAAVLAGIPILTTGCRTSLRSRLMEKQPSPDIPGLSADGYRILHYASLAPSGHNAQPWFVRIDAPDHWTIGLDPDRCLPVVDSNNTEALLSIGAFLENMVQAAASHGYQTHATMPAKDPFDPDVNPDVVSLRLEKTQPTNMDLHRLSSRRTVKNHLSDRQLTPEDVNAFSHLTDGHLFYFANDTTHADHMAEQAVSNYIIQMKNSSAVREMAEWTRLKDTTIKEHRDGLTPAGMEIHGLAGWYVRHFMDQADVTKKTFVEKGIEKTRHQARQGAGWLVITGEGNTVADLLASGRRFQRMALEARNRMIAIHPMSQTLEETRGQKHITKNHGPGTIPHFMLRVGYLDKYPDPVSVRRPVEWFVRT